MKPYKRIVLAVVALLPCVAFGAVCAFFISSQNAFEYPQLQNAVNVENNIVSHNENQQAKAIYANFRDIPIEFGFSYSVVALKNDIYVYDSNQNALYLVKAKLDEFPKSDVDLLKEGISVTGRELYEVVLYLES